MADGGAPARGARSGGPSGAGTGDRHPRVAAGPGRHERPAIDEAALAAAREADRVLAAVRAGEQARWAAFFALTPDRLRDAPLAELRSVALHARASFGPKDSIRDVLPADLTEPFRAALDRLLKALARDEVAG
jgi:hypothetical protein